jgi:hypothetical protein
LLSAPPKSAHAGSALHMHIEWLTCLMASGQDAMSVSGGWAPP